jgi:hypothetical protein
MTEERRYSQQGYARPRADSGSTGGEPAGNRYLQLPPKKAETGFSAGGDFPPILRGL